VWTLARWASADKSVSCPLEARPARIDAPSTPRRSGHDHVSNTAEASHRPAYIKRTTAEVTEEPTRSRSTVGFF
jgi:hypothetical protein